jgi:hypothetical protein
MADMMRPIPAGTVRRVSTDTATITAKAVGTLTAAG